MKPVFWRIFPLLAFILSNIDTRLPRFSNVWKSLLCKGDVLILNEIIATDILWVCRKNVCIAPIWNTLDICVKMWQNTKWKYEKSISEYLSVTRLDILFYCNPIHGYLMFTKFAQANTAQLSCDLHSFVVIKWLKFACTRAKWQSYRIWMTKENVLSLSCRHVRMS